MAGSVKAKTPSPKNVPYTVAGDTLADIWADIEKKGPKVNGKNRAGKTVAKGDANPNCGFKVKEDKKKGVFICDLATSVVNVSLVDCTIDHPKLKSDKNLSAKAKKEWKRFMKELMVHENEHVTAMIDEMKALGKEVVNITKQVEDADKKVAQEKALKEWETDVLAKIDTSTIEARLEKVNKALDSKTGHGPVLDTSIP
ncbi:DUF922 domain-containing protein [Arenibacterium halophilum]|nr:DUF922 domain-containing protein [Arenibacterium halophilum]